LLDGLSEQPAAAYRETSNVKRISWGREGSLAIHYWQAWPSRLTGVVYDDTMIDQ